MGSLANCYGKKKFKTYWEANRVAKGHNRHIEGYRVNIYRCKSCHFWHIGNTLKGGRGRGKRTTGEDYQVA